MDLRFGYFVWLLHVCRHANKKYYLILYRAVFARYFLLSLRDDKIEIGIKPIWILWSGRQESLGFALRVKRNDFAALYITHKIFQILRGGACKIYLFSNLGSILSLRDDKIKIGIKPI